MMEGKGLEGLNSKEKAFLRQRMRLWRAWLWGGPLLALGILLMAAWMLWKHPMLSNPFVLYPELRAKTLPPASLETLAVMVPVLLWPLFLIMFVVVLLLFATFYLERRYLKILGKLRSPGEEVQGRG